MSTHRRHADLTGDSHPAQEPQAANDAARERAMFKQPVPDYTQRPETDPREYNWVATPTMVLVHADQDHQTMLEMVDHHHFSRPHAYGTLLVFDRWDVTWHVDYTNMAFHLVEKSLKKYSKDQGWNFAGILDEDGMPMEGESIKTGSAPGIGEANPGVKDYMNKEWAGTGTHDQMPGPSFGDPQSAQDEIDPSSPYQCSECGLPCANYDAWRRHTLDEHTKGTTPPAQAQPVVDLDEVMPAHFVPWQREQLQQGVISRLAAAPKVQVGDIPGPIPFIFDIEEDRIFVGHPGERHSDIKGKFTPGGIVEGVYDPKGNVQIRTDTDMPYTVRHMLRLWYALHPELGVRGVFLLVGDQRYKLSSAAIGHKVRALLACEDGLWDLAQELGSYGNVYVTGSAIKDVVQGRVPQEFDLVVQGVDMEDLEDAQRQHARTASVQVPQDLDGHQDPYNTIEGHLAFAYRSANAVEDVDEGLLDVQGAEAPGRVLQVEVHEGRPPNVVQSVSEPAAEEIGNGEPGGNKASSSRKGPREEGDSSTQALLEEGLWADTPGVRRVGGETGRGLRDLSSPPSEWMEAGSGSLSRDGEGEGASLREVQQGAGSVQRQPRVVGSSEGVPASARLSHAVAVNVVTGELHDPYHLVEQWRTEQYVKTAGPQPVPARIEGTPKNSTQVAKHYGWELLQGSSATHRVWGWRDWQGHMHTVGSGSDGHARALAEKDAMRTEKTMRQCMGGMCRTCRKPAQEQQAEVEVEPTLVQPGQTVQFQGRNWTVTDVGGGLAEIFAQDNGQHELIPTINLIPSRTSAVKTAVSLQCRHCDKPAAISMEFEGGEIIPVCHQHEAYEAGIRRDADGRPTYKRQAVSNVLDPIQETLDPDVFDRPDAEKPTLKKEIASWVRGQVFRVMRDGGWPDPTQYLNLVLTGSLTTYQWGEQSDFDVSLFVDVERFPDYARSELIALMVENLDGTIVPGTTHPLQVYVVPEHITTDDLYQPGLRSGLDITSGKWIVAPERDRVSDVRARYPRLIAYCRMVEDKMRTLLRYNKYAAREYWHQIHHARQRDQRAGKGDFAESNIIYKWLANQMLFDDISSVIGEYIAKHGERHDGEAVPRVQDREAGRAVQSEQHPEGWSAVSLQDVPERTRQASSGEGPGGLEGVQPEALREASGSPDRLAEVGEGEASADADRGSGWSVHPVRVRGAYGPAAVPSSGPEYEELRHRGEAGRDGDREAARRGGEVHPAMRELPRHRARELTFPMPFGEYMDLITGEYIAGFAARTAAAADIERARFERVPFRVHADRVQGLANEARIKAVNGLRNWAIYNAKSAWEDSGVDMTMTSPEVEANVQDHAERQIRILTKFFAGIPDEAFKVIPWAAREIKRGNLDNAVRVGYSVHGRQEHALDIIGDLGRTLADRKHRNLKSPDVNQLKYRDAEAWLMETREELLKHTKGWEKREPVYTFEDGWSVDKVETKSDLAREGDLMGHCVGGYYHAVEAGDTAIYSLRDQKGLPHVTVEIDPDDAGVVQIFGKSNDEPKPEYKARMREWFQHVNSPAGQHTLDETIQSQSSTGETSYRPLHYKGYTEGAVHDDLRDLHDWWEGQQSGDNDYGLKGAGKPGLMDLNGLMENAYRAMTSDSHTYHGSPTWKHPTNHDHEDLGKALYTAFHADGEALERTREQAQEKLYEWEMHDRDNSWDEIRDMACENMDEHPLLPEGYEWDHNYSGETARHKETGEEHPQGTELWQKAFDDERESAEGNWSQSNWEWRYQKAGDLDQYLYDLHHHWHPLEYLKGIGAKHPPMPGPIPSAAEAAQRRKLDLKPGDPMPTPQPTPQGVTEHVISGWHTSNVHQQVLDANRGQDLQGLPAQPVNVPANGQLSFGSHGGIQQIANDYNQQRGLGEHPTDYTRVNPDTAAKIAAEYDRMEHQPDHPLVRQAYQALARESLDQYHHAVKNGYSFDFYPEGQDPYPNSPREAVLDLHHNKHMKVFPTTGPDGGYGQDAEDHPDHPLLQHAPGVTWSGKPVTYNDIFRAIHDFYGHGKEGLGFRADGEDNAFRQHASMFSPLARRALTSETRGQNSWVNYGPHGAHNQTATSDTIYAPQKAGLMPAWVSDPNLHAQPGQTFSSTHDDHGLEHHRAAGYRPAVDMEKLYDAWASQSEDRAYVVAMNRALRSGWTA